MALLPRFDAPAHLDELPAAGRQAWTDYLGGHTEQFAFTFPQYYDPRVNDTPAELGPTPVAWGAFPARLLGLPDEARWASADADRDEQDEYCEWHTTRDEDGKIVRVTFTTEVPDYWDHLAQHDPDLLLDLYRSMVSTEVELADLLNADGAYRWRNNWNNSTSPGITHLQQPNNNIKAALDLVARATVIRQIGGRIVTDRQQLVLCGGLGDPRRNSDPQIAEIINDAVVLGSEVTLADPAGLYLDSFQSGGILTPDREDAASFWTIERGSPGFALRATFAVPEDRGYTVGDLFIHGRPVRWGAQLADKVRVRVSALAKPSAQAAQPQPCAP